MSHRACVFVGVCASALASTSHGDLVTLTAQHDATLYEAVDGSLANGAGQHFFAGKNGSGALRRSILTFDLSALPSGATVTGVTLTLHYSQGQSTTTTCSLHRALSAWSEGASDPEGNEGGGAASTIGDATWTHTSFDSSFWTTPGGDFSAFASASTSIGAEFGFYSWSSAGLVADVQSWLDGSASNFGWFLLGDEGMAATSKRFDSIQNPNSSFRPTLAISYVIPAPASAMVLLSFIGIGGRRRRREL